MEVFNKTIHSCFLATLVDCGFHAKRVLLAWRRQTETATSGSAWGAPRGLKRGLRFRGRRSIARHSAPQRPRLLVERQPPSGAGALRGGAVWIGAAEASGSRGMVLAAAWHQFR